MELTTRDFYDEIEALSDNLFNDYEYGIISEIEKHIESIEKIRAEIETEEMMRREGKADERAIENMASAMEEEIELVSEMIDDMQLTDIDFDYISDYIHEIADSHEWVIYYGKAWDVARLMSGDDSTCRLFNDLGGIQPGKSLDDLICQFAYCAIEASLQDELENALERKKEELLKKIQN